jgi:glycosyltransferase involved in cell wall biosynthesis
VKILHCIPAIWSGSGGPSRAVIEITRATAAADPAVTSDIATSDYGLSSDWLAHVKSRLPTRTGLFVFHEGGGLDAGWSWAMAGWVWKNVSSYDVVHIHATLSTNSSFCAWAARRHGVPYVIRPLGTLSIYTFTNTHVLRKKIYLKAVDRRLINGAYALHFTARQEQEKAARLRLEAKPVVIPLPFSKTDYQRTSNRKAANILYLSRIHPKKGLDLLLPAFEKVSREFPEARLIVAGAGEPEYENALRRKIDEYGIADLVSFPGFVEGAAKEKLLCESGIFALPSHEENFGVAIIEALAEAIPVVITRGVDTWHDVELYGSGIVAEQTVDGVADALVRLLRDADLRKGMGVSGQRQVGELYAPERVGARLVELYKAAKGTSQ